ncbi:SWIM zinc finger family protein [Streptomyces beijiangensis]|uniref:SWF or SNF family helicase n=1 Tax=Streptomyces beijiangensis TaxID=163361 RepID=A0A939F2N9_9ACTN|nr:SWF or SNF family helicase [Streptomyces beijiangensis]MBO0510746.1 SWF or SNF family helicase [Streptomyces beijiangensis]
MSDHRDGTDGLERTIAALAPVHGRGFAQTWWGLAWLTALEETALDGQQLKKGRKFAREGAVGAVSVRPGRITAVVQDRDGTGRRTDVLLQRLSDEEWDRFLGMAVEQSGHIAALLDREMPPHLVEDASAAGVELLPGIGDLEPECSCEAWDHCPHTAALCYQVARLLDQDPYLLLLMRGRGERELLDELQVRSVALAAPQEAAAEGAGEPAGVPADEAFAARDILPPLPAPPPVPDEPGQPLSLDTESGPAPGLEAAALEFLAADAARRARLMLLEALAPGHEQQPVESELTPGQDAVRLAAAGADAHISARLAAGSGRERGELALAVRAWECGGAAALSVLEEEWTPGPESLARARTQLDQAWEEDARPSLRAARNRWTVTGADAQLRYGQDGRWWPYRKERGRWTPAGPADQDPAAALAVLTVPAGEE